MQVNHNIRRPLLDTELLNIKNKQNMEVYVLNTVVKSLKDLPPFKKEEYCLGVVGVYSSLEEAQKKLYYYNQGIKRMNHNLEEIKTSDSYTLRNSENEWYSVITPKTVY